MLAGAFKYACNRYKIYLYERQNDMGFLWFLTKKTAIAVAALLFFLLLCFYLITMFHVLEGANSAILGDSPNFRRFMVFLSAIWVLSLTVGVSYYQYSGGDMKGTFPRANGYLFYGVTLLGVIIPFIYIEIILI